jgi:hypothetical protein
LFGQRGRLRGSRRDLEIGERDSNSAHSAFNFIAASNPAARPAAAQ